MLALILFVIAVALVGFAIWKNYGKTDPTQSPAQRTRAAIYAALASLAASAAALLQYFFQTPPA